MTQEEIDKKAFTLFPVKRGAYGRDLNEGKRNSYIKGLIEGLKETGKYEHSD